MFPNSLVVCIPDIAAAFGFIYLIGGMGVCVCVFLWLVVPVRRVPDGARL